MRTAAELTRASDEAVRQGDADAFACLYATDAEIVGPGGRVMQGHGGARHFFSMRREWAASLQMRAERERWSGGSLIVEGVFNPAGRGLGGEVPQGQMRDIRVPYAEILTAHDDVIRTHAVYFDNTYGRTQGRKPPWDIGVPQPAIMRLAESGLITGRVLDVGCGSGDNTLYLAGCGLEVFGIDASRLAIHLARLKAAEKAAIRVRFDVADALELTALNDRFDTSLDSGLLHALPEEDWSRLVSGLHHVLRPGGRHHLMCLSEQATLPGPHRFSPERIKTVFADGWRVDSIVPYRFELVPSSEWSPDAAAAWLASISRL